MCIRDRLICWRETNGNLQSIIYDNDGSRPIAQIVNARVTTPINGSYRRSPTASAYSCDPRPDDRENHRSVAHPALSLIHI